MKKLAICSVAILAAFLFNGCISSTGSYTSNAKFDSAYIGPLQRRAIAYEGIYRNPVILVHGFLGANLINSKTGKSVWGKFTASETLGLPDNEIRNLSVPMRLGAKLSELKNSTVAGTTLDTITIKILGVPFKVNAYQNLINSLQEGGYQPEGRPLDPGKNFHNLFQFSYDWRRDLQESAAKLHEFILKKRAYIQHEYEALYGIKNYDVQFDIIGHSMGGLVSRYYLRYGSADLPAEGEKPVVTWAGSKYIDRLILIGTPNAGYLDTIFEMKRGRDIPPMPPALLCTWPSYYQMLPVPTSRSVVEKSDSSKSIDYLDPTTWERFGWGLADPKQDATLKILLPKIKTAKERRAIAEGHLRKCLSRAKRFIAAMRVRSTPPPDVQLYLVAGNAVKTRRKATVDSTTGKLKATQFGSGDGKVLKTSAMFDERAGARTWLPFFFSPIAWRTIIQLRAAHMGLTTVPAFKDNVLFLLSSIPPPRYQKVIEAYRKTLEGN